MCRIRMLVLFMYLRQNSHRYSFGSLETQKKIAIFRHQCCFLLCTTSFFNFSKNMDILYKYGHASYMKTLHFTIPLPPLSVQTKVGSTRGTWGSTLWQRPCRCASIPANCSQAKKLEKPAYFDNSAVPPYTSNKAELFLPGIFLGIRRRIPRNNLVATKLNERGRASAGYKSRGGVQVHSSVSFFLSLLEQREVFLCYSWMTKEGQRIESQT